jgi:hypothetical protein
LQKFQITAFVSELCPQIQRHEKTILQAKWDLAHRPSRVLEQGLGTTVNLMMVDGADTFLDHLSDQEDEVWVHFSYESFEGAKYELLAQKKLRKDREVRDGSVRQNNSSFVLFYYK